MKLELFCLALLFLPFLASNEIKGGPKVSTDEFPFIARLYIGGEPCTGSLVKDNLILTAAHCFGNGKTGTLDFSFYPFPKSVYQISDL